MSIHGWYDMRRHELETHSMLLALCEENRLGSVEFSSQRLIMWVFAISYIIVNKLVCKYSSFYRNSSILFKFFGTYMRKLSLTLHYSTGKTIAMGHHTVHGAPWAKLPVPMVGPAIFCLFPTKNALYIYTLRPIPFTSLATALCTLAHKTLAPNVAQLLNLRN